MPRRTMARISQRRLYPAAQLIECKASPKAPCSQLDAATQGLGVAFESVINAQRHLADGKLVELFGMNKVVRVKAHFAAYPERHAKRPAVEAFLS